MVFSELAQKWLKRHLIAPSRRFLDTPIAHAPCGEVRGNLGELRSIGDQGVSLNDAETTQMSKENIYCGHRPPKKSLAADVTAAPGKMATKATGYVIVKRREDDFPIVHPTP